MDVAPELRNSRQLARPTERARTEDRDAEIFRALYKELRRVAATVAPPSCEPDDLVQQATMNALAHGPLHRLDHPAAYLKASIVNLAKNLYRRGSLSRTSDCDGDEHTDTYPSDLADLASLSPLDRTAVFLVEIERLPYREAASILECSSPALRARVMRARRKLRSATIRESAQ